MARGTENSIFLYFFFFLFLIFNAIFFLIKCHFIIKIPKSNCTFIQKSVKQRKRFHILGKQKKVILELLGIPNPELHTGQCWRGTPATFGADEGLNENQLMAVTGHKSIAALKTYTANSFIQKRTAAQAFSISGSSNQDHLVNRGKENVEIKKNQD